MAPEIALRSLTRLPSGSVVLDPMAGSGTVLRAASDLGHQAIGADLDPLAVLMARVWTQSLSPRRLRAASEQLLERASDRTDIPRLDWIDDDPETLAFVDFWFGARQRDDLRRIVSSLPTDGSTTGRALRLLISKLIITKEAGASLARDVSHSRPHRTKSANSFDVFSGFQRACERLASILEAEPPSSGVRVRLGDARRLRFVTTGSVDHVVSSPPYLNGIDYLRGHRLALVWLGFPLWRLREIRRESVGSERKLPRDGLKSRPAVQVCSEWMSKPLDPRWTSIVRRYLWDLQDTTAEIARVARPGAEVTLVVGNPTLRSSFIDTAAMTTAACTRVGLTLRDRYERDLPARHRYLPPPASASTSLDQRLKTEVVLNFVRT